MAVVVRNASLEDDRVELVADGGKIVALGPVGSVSLPAGAEEIDATGLALLPGLVNGHTHSAMTLFRGFGDDLPLDEWLRSRIWPAEARLSEDDVFWGAKLAGLEMLRTGTVAFWDMYWHPRGVVRAVDELGLRATVAAPLIDGHDPSRLPELQDAVDEATEAASGASDRVRAALGPHAIYTVSTEGLSWVAEQAADRGLPVHIHCSETEREVHDCVAAHGVRPVIYLDRLGLLGERTVLAHGIWLDDEERDVLATRGTTIVTTPTSNLKLAVGDVFRYQEARRRGIPVGLGTDGVASNNALDLFQEVKLFALLQKHVAKDPSAVPAAEAWDVAAGHRAPLLGPGGRLAVGEPADFLLARLDQPELAPAHDQTSNLVYAATGACVDTVVIDGVVRMRHRVVPGQDDIVAEATARAHRICRD
ncbi:MAG: amidohydrolase [Acidimicrobiales bacterium]|nr:amidohydrolase [Acidimicrobiales bacterium]